MKKVHLNDLIPYLENARVKLELNFLRKLFIEASGSLYPCKDKDFAQKLGCLYNDRHQVATAIRGWCEGKRTIPFSKLKTIIYLTNSSWIEVENKLTLIKAGRRRGQVYIKFPIKIDEKFGTIIGHILGDGSIDKKYSQVFFSNSNIELLTEFRNAMNKVFGIEPRIWIRTGNGFKTKNRWVNRVNDIRKKKDNQSVGLFYPRICGIILHAVFGVFANGRRKLITNEMKSSPNQFKRSLLRAFFDDESYVGVGSQQIRLPQDNNQILEDIRDLLREFDIMSNPIHFYIKGNKKRYYFNITHIKNYYQFYCKIGFTSSYKMKELEKLIGNVRRSKKYKNLVLPEII